MIRNAFKMKVPGQAPRPISAPVGLIEIKRGICTRHRPFEAVCPQRIQALCARI
jgi:hypothetical protein